MLKNDQMQGARGIFLPDRQAILRSEVYLAVLRSDEG
jgi:hypothetical protein